MSKAYRIKSVVTHSQKVRFWLASVLVLLAPFHAFLITWAKNLGIPGEIAIWRELFVVLITLLIGLELVLQRQRIRIKMLDWTIIVYAALALLWLPYQGAPLSVWALGIRFSVMPFVFFVIVRQVTWPQIDTLYKLFLGSAAVTMIFGILHTLILPQDFLTVFGYSTSQEFFVHTNALSACQYLEFTDAICRATSTFGGPTRYGSYLLLIIGMLFPLFQNVRTRQFGLSMLSIALLNILFTYSRSIWIGTIAAGVLLIFFLWPKFTHKVKSYIRYGSVLCILTVVLLGAIAVRGGDNSLSRKILIRDTSSGIHLQYAKEGIERLRAHPLGIGVGRVGPASTRFKTTFGEPILTENWYLQIAGEMGIPGLALFLTMLYLFFEELYHKRSEPLARGLFFTLAAISVAGLFTHSFEETSTVLVLMMAIGMTRQ